MAESGPTEVFDGAKKLSVQTVLQYGHAASLALHLQSHASILSRCSYGGFAYQSDACLWYILPSCKTRMLAGLQFSQSQGAY
jgi:hypothetical protein